MIYPFIHLPNIDRLYVVSQFMLHLAKLEDFEFLWVDIFFSSLHATIRRHLRYFYNRSFGVEAKKHQKVHNLAKLCNLHNCMRCSFASLSIKVKASIPFPFVLWCATNTKIVLPCGCIHYSWIWTIFKDSMESRP